MSIEVKRSSDKDRPRINSDGDFTGTSLFYLVYGADTEDEAVQAVHGYAPGFYNNMARMEIELEDFDGLGIYKVRADYEFSADSLTSDDERPPSSFSFEVSGENRHIKQSVKTIARYPSSAPDYNGAIGFDGETIQGTNVFCPFSSFTERHYFRDSQITAVYKKNLAIAVGAMNYDNFRGYEPGEVLFVGASGDKLGRSEKNLWAVTFKFAVSPNQRNIKIGDITVNEKYGWDYLWVRYASALDSTRKHIIKKPVAAYVERVYNIVKYEKLGI